MYNSYLVININYQIFNIDIFIIALLKIKKLNFLEINLDF
uniref:Uncharacterized protein n=1 Tax=viral metagenome TaxID=1070528 RepID=A0A6C0H7X4_9ZZZZ